MCGKILKYVALGAISCALLREAAGMSKPTEPASGGGYKNIFRVACLGDSITFGAGVSDQAHHSYPALLGQWLGPKWDVRNFGVRGATLLKKGNKPYKEQPEFAAALQFKPDVVIIKLGTNDSKHPGAGAQGVANNWRYKADFAQDYTALLTEFRKANPNIKVFLCLPVPAYAPEKFGVDGTAIREEIVPLIRRVAASAGAEVIDLHSALSGKPELFPDTVHPNDAGTRLIAVEVYRVLSDKEPPPAPNKSAAAR
jgi:acyl-CoA thioesterase I